MKNIVRVSYWQYGRIDSVDAEVDAAFFHDFFPECKGTSIYFISRAMAETLIRRRKKGRYRFDGTAERLESFFTDYLEDYRERNVKPRVLLELESRVYPNQEELRSFRSGFHLTTENRATFLENIDTLIERYLSEHPKHKHVSCVVDALHATYHVKEKYHAFVTLCLRDRLKPIPKITIRKD